MTTSTTATGRAAAMPLLTAMAPTTGKRSLPACAGLGTERTNGAERARWSRTANRWTPARPVTRSTSGPCLPLGAQLGAAPRAERGHADISGAACGSPFSRPRPVMFKPTHRRNFTRAILQSVKIEYPDPESLAPPNRTGGLPFRHFRM